MLKDYGFRVSIPACKGGKCDKNDDEDIDENEVDDIKLTTKETSQSRLCTRV